MSADDFQAKYASVMESMLKNAVAETTKLFEKMVDELKAEISKIKQENEDLKTRCSKFEEAKSKPVVDNGEIQCLPAQSDDSGKRDSAVQCDLVPFRTVLVEQCQPLSNGSLENHAYEEMQYGMQEHMGTLAVKQEESSDLSVLKQEDAGSPQAVVNQIENEAPPIIRECSAEDVSPQNDNLTCLVKGDSIQGGQNWSHDPEPSVAISLAVMNDSIEEEPGEKMQEEHATPEKPPEQNEGRTSGNGQTDVNEKQYTDVQLGEVENCVTEVEGGAKFKLSVRCKRRQPSKNVKQSKVIQSSSADVPKDISSSVDTVNISSSKIEVQPEETSPVCTQPVQDRPGTAVKDMMNGQLPGCLPEGEKHKTSDSQQPSVQVEEEGVKAPPGTSVQLKQRHNSVTYQDALLLVEAMNQSTVEMTFASPQKMAPVQTKSAPSMDISEMPDKVSAEPVTPLIPVQAVSTPGVSPHIRGAPLDAKAQILAVTPKQQHSSAPFDTSLKSSSGATTKTAAQPLPHPVTSTVANKNLVNIGTHRIIIVPRPASSVAFPKIAALSSTQRPAVSSTAAQNNHTSPTSTVTKSSPGTPSHSSASQKTIIIPTKSLPVVHTQVTTTSENPPQKIKIIIPRRSSAVTKLQINCLTEKTQSAAPAVPAAPVTGSTSDLMSESQESSDSDRVYTASPQNTENTTDSLQSLSHAASVSEKDTCFMLKTSDVSTPALTGSVAETEPDIGNIDNTDVSVESDSCSGLKTSGVPTSPLPVVQKKLSAVVRLTRLPFPISTEESISLSELLLMDSYKDCSSHSISCSEMTSMSPEMCPVLDDASLSSYVQPDLHAEPTPVAKKTTSNTEQETQPKDMSGTHLQTTTSQFPAELQVSPTALTPNKVTPDDGGSNTQTRMSDRRCLRMNSLVSRLRSHLKSHSQARGTKAHTEKENTAVSSEESQSDSNGRSDENIMSPRKVTGRKTNLSPNLSPWRSSSNREPNTVRIKESPKTPRCMSPQRSSMKRISVGANTDMCSRLRSCSFISDGPSSKKIKRDSGSFSPMRGRLTKSEICSPREKSPQQNRMSGESTPVNKHSLIQSQKSQNVANALKVAKAARAKMIAKIKSSNPSKLQTRKSARIEADCKVVKRCKTTGVWIPPTWEEFKKVLEKEKEQESLLPVKSEPVQHPVVIKPGPFVSPLQPLSVIGRHLLRNQCGECGRVLSSAAALESHVSLHTGRRPFSCSLCGKTFPDLKSFKRHGRVHQNGKIYKCPQCGKGFAYKFGLNKHIQMVHGRIKPFNCQICNKQFFSNRDVIIHLRSHTGEKPFQCNLCERKFARRVELNVHLRWHNGEKRHWCPYCGKGFLDCNNLKRHKYIHTGEKPHSCPHCPKHFTQSGHLKKHVKNVHKVK